MKIKIFRWRAVGPLLVLVVIAAVLWWRFADTIARHESQKHANNSLTAACGQNGYSTWLSVIASAAGQQVANSRIIASP